MVRTRSLPAEPFRKVDLNLPGADENVAPQVTRRAVGVPRHVMVLPSIPGANLHRIPHRNAKGSSLNETPLETEVSPVLQKLMQTPGRTYQTQQLLIRKHHEAKSHAEAERCVGGGVSLWPGMSNMRLTSSDLWSLSADVVTLVLLTLGLFYYLHGATLSHLHHFIRQLRNFSSLHHLDTNEQTRFDESLLGWHREYSVLLRQIRKSVEVSWDSCPPTYPLAIFLYVSGICTLLFYIYENVFAKSRLTPRRIKQWISLLVILMTWTLLMLYLLLQAQKLEYLVKGNVHTLNNYMEGVIFTELDLTKYESTLRYWTTLCLPPRAEGVLSILGAVKVQDFTYYLAYYSLPVATALLTPVVRLVVSLREVYRVKPRPNRESSL